MRFKSLHRSDIEASLDSTTRQYLVGNLKKKQLLDHIDDQDLEIGISSYLTASHEVAHTHKTAKEYQYVLCGMTEYMDLDSGTVHEFIAGSFYVIYPGTKYIQKIKQGTRILFIKYPAGDDKEFIDCSPESISWAAAPLRVTRVDYAGGKAPEPNSLKPSAAAAVIDDESRLLLVKRRDSGFWAMPGGTMEMNENLADCAIREILEETGIHIEIAGIIGTYTNPDNIVSYSDGEVRREFSVLFAGKIRAGDLRLDDESTDVNWVSFEKLSSYPMAESQRQRIADVLEYCRSAKTSIR
jgi:8-oxo-dGTP pyrophosphatase MutT (NUDIX family)/uncharacterized cupin superfamily protein